MSENEVHKKPCTCLADACSCFVSNTTDQSTGATVMVAVHCMGCSQQKLHIGSHSNRTSESNESCVHISHQGREFDVNSPPVCDTMKQADGIICKQEHLVCDTMKQADSGGCDQEQSAADLTIIHKVCQCEKCSAGSSCSFALERHSESRSGEAPFVCEACAVSFRHRYQLNKHMHRHSDSRPFKCDQCPGKFKRASTLKSHNMIHTGEKPFMCEVCARVFVYKVNLHTHLKSHSDRRPFQCDRCSAAFKHSGGLKEHFRTHTGERLFKCEQCPKAFMKHSHRSSHMKIHSDVKPFKCDLCTQQFKFNNALQAHIKRVHRKEKDHACELCPSAFSCRSDLKKHSKKHSLTTSHSDNKSFKCSQCSAGFTQRYSLKVHMLLHTGEKPFACDVCAKSFVTRSNLNIHATTHSDSRPYKCNLCTAQYKQSSSLNDHKKTHSGEKPYKCQQCPAAFARSTHLKGHMQMHVGYRPFKCDHCPAQFKRSNELKRHIKKTHSLNVKKAEGKARQEDGSTSKQTRPLFVRNNPKNRLHSFSSEANIGGNEAVVVQRHNSHREKESSSRRSVVCGWVEQRGVPSPQVDQRTWKAHSKSVQNSGCAERVTIAGIQTERDSPGSSKPTSSLKASRTADNACLSTIESGDESSMDKPLLSLSPKQTDSYSERDQNIGAWKSRIEAPDPDNSWQDGCLMPSVKHLEECVSSKPEKEPASVNPQTDSAWSTHSATPATGSSQSQQGLSLMPSTNQLKERVSSKQEKEPASVKRPQTDSAWSTHSATPATGSSQSQQGLSLMPSTNQLKERVSSEHQAEPTSTSVQGSQSHASMEKREKDFSESEPCYSLETGRHRTDNIIVGTTMADEPAAVTPDASDSDDSHTPGSTQEDLKQPARNARSNVLLHRDRKRHNNLKCFECDQCFRQFARRFDLKRHEQQVHGGHAPSEESEVSASACHLIAHAMTLAGKKTFRCELCPKEFGRLSDKNRHVKRHSDDKPFDCALCAKPFNFTYELKAHMKRVHSGESAERGERVHVCEVCPAAFHARGSLKKHMKRHSDSRPFLCHQCTASFKCASSLKTHGLLHAGDKPFQCELCGKSFVTKTNLHIHMKVHSDSRPYKCNLCAAQYKQPSSLNDHKKTHSGEKPYKCPQCPAAFARSTHLKGHMQMHVGYRPFKCDHCPTQFKRSNELKRHERTHVGYDKKSRLKDPTN